MEEKIYFIYQIIVNLFINILSPLCAGGTGEEQNNKQ